MITPINTAEAIIEPFWDAQVSGIREWTLCVGEERVVPPAASAQDAAASMPADHYDYDALYKVGPLGAASGAAVKLAQTWCWVSFSWERIVEGQPIFKMSRCFDLDVADYDRLILSLALPEGAGFRMQAKTDRGLRSTEMFDLPSGKLEASLELDGAAVVESLEISLFSRKDAPGGGWLNWIGLQSSTKLPGLLGAYARFDPRWHPHLVDESFTPSFRPRSSLWISEDELEDLRREWAEGGPGVAALVAEGRTYGDTVPEASIGDFVNFWDDKRYNRVRDEGKHLLRRGPAIALAALITRDSDLLRLAARYALSLVSCEHWDTGFLCFFPGSAWEHKAFVPSLCLLETTLILEAAWELLTPVGQNVACRRLAEEQGFINYNVWKYGNVRENIFRMNQLAWFSPGRIASLCFLESLWPRVKEQTDSAYRDLLESLESTVLGDGGYAEGPSYFAVVGKAAATALALYARSRNLAVGEVAPARLARTVEYADAVSSTRSDADVIPICDGRHLFDEESLGALAVLFPGSAWDSMLRKKIEREGGPRSLTAWRALRNRSPAASVAAPSVSAHPAAAAQLAATPANLIVLAETGLVVSQRRHRGQPVKLLLMGNRAGAGHTHEDKGSFVVEFGGEPYAVDPGIGNYDNPVSMLMKGCAYHNMLVPLCATEGPAPRCPLPATILPMAEGDASRFRAEADLTPGWEPWYRRWHRIWDSPDAATLIIRDEYDLVRGEGVAFQWITSLAIEIVELGAPDVGEAGAVAVAAGGAVVAAGAAGAAVPRVRIHGKNGSCLLSAEGCSEARVDELSLPDGSTLHRLRFIRRELSGSLSVRAEWT